LSADLRSITRAEEPIEPLLERAGRIVRAYREQDSGCRSYVVEVKDERLFVKVALTEAGRASLDRAAAVHASIEDTALPPLLRTFDTIEGPAHVYEWVPGEVLYDPVSMPGEQGRSDPASGHARFRALPVSRILDALDVIYALHVRIARAGLIAVDFYDGSILYDFERHRSWICDLDEYRPGPFVLEADRLPGSRRFMAPEESVRGSTIDERTNVFTLARAAIVLLSDGDLDSDAWRGTGPMRRILRRATRVHPEGRFAGVADFVDAWSAASARRPDETDV